MKTFRSSFVNGEMEKQVHTRAWERRITRRGLKGLGAFTTDCVVEPVYKDWESWLLFSNAPNSTKYHKAQYREMGKHGPFAGTK